MRTPIAISATVLLALTTACTTAEAATYQTGAMTYAVNGSYSSVTTGRDRCEVATGPDTTDLRDYTYRVIEKGTFSSGKGVAHYQGNVGSQPFFLGNGDRPAKLTVKATMVVQRSVTCKYAEPEDCGTKTVKGVVRSEFEGASDLKLSFAGSAHSFDLRPPFKTCGGVGGGGTSLLNAISGATARPDLQGRALHYPSARTFWAHKRRTMKGTAKSGGDTLSITLKTSRRTLSSKRSLHP